MLEGSDSEEEMPSSSSSPSRNEEMGFSSFVISLLTASSLEAAELLPEEADSLSGSLDETDDGTELSCASDAGALLRTPAAINATATTTARTMAAIS